MFNQGDIVEIYFDLPNQKEIKLHPAIILSNNQLFELQQVYVCVMMTSSNIEDEFSFFIDDSMLLNKSNKKLSQARCHLITYAAEKHFQKRKLNTIKIKFINALLDKINLSVLNTQL